MGHPLYLPKYNTRYTQPKAATNKGKKGKSQRATTRSATLYALEDGLYEVEISPSKDLEDGERHGWLVIKRNGAYLQLTKVGSCQLRREP